MRNKLWSLVGLTASLLAGTAMAQPATSSSDDWMGDWLNNGQWYVGGKAGIGWLNHDTRLRTVSPTGASRAPATVGCGRAPNHSMARGGR